MVLPNIFQQGMFSVDPDSTPDQLARRRQKVQQMFANGGQSRSVAEGLVKLAGGAVAGLRNRSANNLEREKTGEATDLFERIMGARSNVTPTPNPILGGAPIPQVQTEPLLTPEQQVGADTRAALGMESAMPASLIRTESGGNFGALNNEVGAGGVRGHGGRAQMGYARLQDAAAAGIIPPGTTPEQYAQMPPETQIAVENWHVGDIDRAIDELGAVGQTINGVQVTRDGLRSVAHLGGIGGMRKYVQSGGQYNPSDSFGTSLADYASEHSSGGQSPQVSNFAQNNMQDLMAAMANPWMTPDQKAVLGGMIAQQQQNADPLRQLQIQQAQLDLERSRNPQPEPGYTQVTPQEVAAMGLEPGAYQRAPDGKISKIGGGGVNVTVGGESEIGTIPQGYELFTDPQTGARSLRAIPGGPEDTAAKDEMRSGMADSASEVVTTAAARARAADQERAVRGLFGNIAAMNPSSQNAEIVRQVDTLKSIAAAENINAMRQASPTGGALGNASDADIKLLKDKSGALDPASPYFARDLADYERTLLRTIHGPEAGDKIFEETRGSDPPQDNDGWTTLPNGVRIREVN